MKKIKKEQKISIKLQTGFIVAMSLSIILLIIIQSYVFAKSNTKTMMDNLNMLTDQVALNFAENQRDVEDAVYSRATTYSIPALMACFNSENAADRRSLQNAVFGMVSYSDSYDFVMIQTSDGVIFDTGMKNSGIEVKNIENVKKTSKWLLKKYADDKHLSNVWYRDENGDVYLLKYIYDVNPLAYGGHIVVHIKGQLFTLSTYYQNITFLFFDTDKHFITESGMNLSEELQGNITDVLKESLNGYKYYGKNEFMLANSKADGWMTVGISSMTSIWNDVMSMMKIGLIIGIITIFIGFCLQQMTMNSMLHKLDVLQDSMKAVSNGKIDTEINVIGDDDISQLQKTFNNMTGQIRKLMGDVVEKERMRKNVEYQMLEYKYRSLETQIRPHFIYNALESINSMAKMDNNIELTKVIQMMSRYFRNITDNSSRQFITVKEEFDNLRDYTDIYKMIHGNRIEVIYQYKEAAKNGMIPTMILQPIVENAFKHGMLSKHKKIQVIIHAYREQERLFFTVKDNGDGLSKTQENIFQKNGILRRKERTGVGIGNVMERLKLLYGERASFEIFNREGGGCEVRISVPFEYNEPMSPEMDILDELALLDKGNLNNDKVLESD